MTFEVIIVLLLLSVLAMQLRLFARSKEMEQRQQALQQTVKDEAHRAFNQFEAYHYLRDRLNLRDGMPYTTDWSAAPDFLKIIVEHCLERKPQTIVECSSGLTTVMLARCCELNDSGHVYSLENGEEYAAKSRDNLQRYQLESDASVIHAPLQNYTINSHDYQWYALGDLPDHSIDMLVIDGPPGFLQKHSRYPALPLLRDKLADGCTIFLDDAARPDEREIVAMWREMLPRLEHHYIRTERGCSVLMMGA